MGSELRGRLSLRSGSRRWLTLFALLTVFFSSLKPTHMTNSILSYGTVPGAVEILSYFFDFDSSSFIVHTVAYVGLTG